jgi:formamidopyrimidine-DNA glycosylase
MPEMPEVETICRSLRKHVEGKVVREVEIRLPRLIKWPSPEDFRAILGGRTIATLERRAKYMLFHVTDGWAMVIHLRMTGRLFYRDSELPSDAPAKIIFHFTGGDSLEYSDTRTLGTLYLLRENELDRIYGLSSLGPEPLSPEFSVEYMAAGLAKRKGKLKSVLLDQRFIGGLGNIYVDESLARAGLHPERKANSLEAAEIGRLYESVNEVISKGICGGGTTLRDYRDGEGNSGSFQEELCVYGRKGLPCPVCGTVIVRTEVAGRGTHYCPQCQHLE